MLQPAEGLVPHFASQPLLEDGAMDVLTLLCIGDRPQLLELRRALLESHGYRVKMALSGHTALKMLENTPVAAVLLEYKTEGMDAEAVAYHVKLRFPQHTDHSSFSLCLYTRANTVVSG
jgi:response regulator RpfG family c-di-GMP phosphodiesterase